MNRLTLRLVLLLASMGAAMAVHAVEMYRWVDEHGVVNISDVVPEKYKKTAVKVDSSQFNVAPGERRDAAAQQAALIASAAEVSPLSASQAARAASALPPARAGDASSSPTGPDCAVLLQRYRDATACFEAGAKNANGSVNASKSVQCPLVVDPSPQCGGVRSVSPR